jgi:hypothetical protein
VRFTKEILKIESTFCLQELVLLTEKPRPLTLSGDRLVKKMAAAGMDGFCGSEFWVRFLHFTY